MIYTEKIKAAIKFSIKTHEVYQKQKRKGKDIAYVTHPMTVGLILSLAGAKEEVIAAGILHDTIEDSPDHKKVDVEMLTDRFGGEVAHLVMSVTETDKASTWEERKQAAHASIKFFSRDSNLLKSADVLANTSEIVDDFRRHGDKVFERFSASKEKTLEHYQAVIEEILFHWPENPLRQDLLAVSLKLKDLS